MIGSERVRVSSEEFSELLGVCGDENRIGGSSVGWRLINGGDTAPLRFTCGEESVYVALQSVSRAVEVNRREREILLSYAVVVDRENDQSWVLEEDSVEKVSCLPRLATEFHKGEGFRDREADYRYIFDDRDSIIAVPSSRPVERPEEQIRLERMRFLGGLFPREWLFEGDNESVWYLRERSGLIVLYEGFDSDPDNCVFHSYVGREHPGTHMTNEEVLQMVTSLDNIDISDNPGDVSQETVDLYYSKGLSAEEVDEDLDSLFEEG